MSAQHTPGPWKYNADSQNIVFDGGPESTLLLDPYEPKYSNADDATDDWYIGSVGGHWCDRPSEEIDANGLLIAAAPDLLAALEGFANIGEYRELREAMAACLREHERAGFLASFEAAKAAIAKAKGEGA